MPPRLYSRYMFSIGLYDSSDRFAFTDRSPFRYKVFSDNIQHTVVEGDTLFTLAGSYFAPLDRPAGLWWIIADFQPVLINDPTLALTVGRTIFIPSIRTVNTAVFSEKRRRESVA